MCPCRNRTGLQYGRDPNAGYRRSGLVQRWLSVVGRLNLRELEIYGQCRNRNGR
jgi:hypothetical protein